MKVSFRAGGRMRGAVVATVVMAALPISATRLAAQTDYYNTDAGRPLRIEDAYPVERRAFEIQAAPLRLERARGGVYHWGIEPELAFGVLPRTQIEVGVPFAYIDAGSAGRSAGIAGIEVAALHNLNTETSIPALGVAGSVLIPAGSLAPDDPYVSLKALGTRTFPWMRFHLNVEHTFGSLPDQGPDGAPADAGASELSQWVVGIAADRVYPLRALLVSAEVFAREPMGADGELEWNTGAGVRYQLSPRFNLDAGVGRRITGDDQGWYMTFGTAYAVGLPWRVR